MSLPKNENTEYNFKGLQAVGGSNMECAFCNSSEDDEFKLGKKYIKNTTCVHYFCMLFASGLSQKGRSDRDGILGFLLPDIAKEVKRAARLKCSYCKNLGATIGCVRANCRMSFHFGCGIESGTLNQFYGNFSSFCSEHRPFQVVPESERQEEHEPVKRVRCIICMSKVEAQPSCTSLRTPCCKANSWYHKDCMQRMASASGLHFFKCPLCNNKDAFQREMMEFGIYIPDRDAEWELEPNAFRELYERHNVCDQPRCLCPRGRKYNREDTSWEIILCDWCGHQGCHLKCGNLASPYDEWICNECVEISVTTALPSLHLKPKKKKKVKSMPVPSQSSSPPLPSTSVGTHYKRKYSSSSSSLERTPKKKRLSSGSASHRQSLSPGYEGRARSKENTPGQRKKRKRGRPSRKSKLGMERGGSHLPYFMFSPSNHKQTSYELSKRISKHKQVAGKEAAKCTLDAWLSGSSMVPKTVEEKPSTSLQEEVQAKKEEGEEKPSASPCAADLRAQRAQRRSQPLDIELNERMPTWLKIHLSDDIITGSNLGAKFLSLAMLCKKDVNDVKMNAPTAKTSSREKRMERRQSESNWAKHKSKNMPRWVTNLLNEDYITGRNLGRKLSAMSPSISSSEGGNPGQGRRGKQSSDCPSDHAGSQVSSSSTVPQQSFDSELKGSVRETPGGSSSVEDNDMPPMKYAEFLDYLSTIGFPHQAALPERLSLYQQYLDGEFKIITLDDLVVNDLEEGRQEAVSPATGEESSRREAEPEKGESQTSSSTTTTTTHCASSLTSETVTLPPTPGPYSHSLPLSPVHHPSDSQPSLLPPCLTDNPSSTPDPPPSLSPASSQTSAIDLRVMEDGALPTEPPPPLLPPPPPPSPPPSEDTTPTTTTTTTSTVSSGGDGVGDGPQTSATSSEMGEEGVSQETLTHTTTAASSDEGGVEVEPRDTNTSPTTSTSPPQVREEHQEKAATPPAVSQAYTPMTPLLPPLPTSSPSLEQEQEEEGEASEVLDLSTTGGQRQSPVPQTTPNTESSTVTSTGTAMTAESHHNSPGVSTPHLVKLLSSPSLSREVNSATPGGQGEKQEPATEVASSAGRPDQQTLLDSQTCGGGSVKEQEKAGPSHTKEEKEEEEENAGSQGAWLPLTAALDVAVTSTPQHGSLLVTAVRTPRREKCLKCGKYRRKAVPPLKELEVAERATEAPPIDIIEIK